MQRIFSFTASEPIHAVALALRDLTFREMCQLGDMLDDAISHQQSREDVVTPMEIAQAVSEWAHGYGEEE